MFFWNASWKASWRVLEAKIVPKPSKITPKMDPKEAHRALQKGKDFNKDKQWKKARKIISQTKAQQRQNSENVDFSLVVTV